MSAKAVYSLESLKMGASGVDGAMGSSLANISKIAAGTVQFAWPEPTQTNLTAEEDNSPWVQLQQNLPKVMNWESQDMSPENMLIAFGGAIATAKLIPGVNFSIPTQSLEIITRSLKGAKAKWQFPLVQVVASISGSLQKTDLLKIKFTATVLQPVDAGGVALADFTYAIV